jgi:hypothetical protein
VDQSEQRRMTYTAASDGQNKAFEFAIIPGVFGLLGYGLDRWIGIIPVLTIVFVLVSFVGLGVRAWFTYDAQMKIHDANGVWGPNSTSSASAPSPTATPVASGGQR